MAGTTAPKMCWEGGGGVPGNLAKTWRGCAYWKGAVVRTVASLPQLRQNSHRRARRGLGEPQPWYGCPTPDKGRDISSGRQSFYYLIIPSVVTEIPPWSPYSVVDVSGGRRSWVGRGGIIYKAGREQGPERTLGQPVSSRALRTLCFFPLVDVKLPGKGFVFLL